MRFLGHLEVFPQKDRRRIRQAQGVRVARAKLGRDQIVRIAHIGYLDYLDCVAIIAGIEQLLAQLKPGSFQLGDGLRAAQLVYADASKNGERP